MMAGQEFVSAIAADRTRHNREAASRLTFLVIAAAAALLLQQLFAPDSPQGSVLDRAYIAIYTSGLIGAVLSLGVIRLTSPEWISRFGRVAWLSVGVLFVAFCTGLSVIDIAAGSEPIAYVVGLLVFGPMFRAPKTFYLTLIISSVLILSAAHIVLVRSIDVDALVAEVIVGGFSVWLAISTEARRIEMHRLREELSEQNRILDRERSTDALTGLMSRRATIEALDRLYAISSRHSIPVAVGLIDLDHFKKINDTHGHAAGDTVLRLVAGVLRETVRESDLVGRFGGEEFIIILPRTELARARDVCDRARAEIGLQTTGAGFGVTASIGITVICPESDDGALATVGRADKALYAAKDAGRDRVFVGELPERCASTE
jgi:diguanylate cyclase (GGDEF)-like protein